MPERDAHRADGGNGQGGSLINAVGLQQGGVPAQEHEGRDVLPGGDEEKDERAPAVLGITEHHAELLGHGRLAGLFGTRLFPPLR